MRPLSLTLKGFRGIRDGLGRDELTLDLAELVGDAQLIALAGANGRGKTTLIDSMHPFLVMPSRASVAGPGGFSYYDHVYLPENEKELIWEHEGRRYRSHVVIRLNGKRRTEAFLFEWHQSHWKPLRLDDGTLSDGRVETYERCIETICGSAETFFTSVFSAQGKRQLSSYKNAEIKALLADLLGLEEIRALGQRASETAKLLKAGLTAIRQEQAGLEAEMRQLGTERTRLGVAQRRVEQACIDKTAAQRALDVARAAQGKLTAERDQAQGIEARRSQLRAERQAVVDAGRQAIAALDAQEAREQQRLDRLEQRITARAEQVRARRRTLEGKRQALLSIVAAADSVRRAGRRLALAERVVARRAERVGELRASAERVAQLRANEKVALEKRRAIEREAGQATLKAAELKRRFGLTVEVPCAGSDLPNRCKLLGDAREAKALMPSADLQIARLGEQRVAINGEVAGIRAELTVLADIPIRLTAAECRLECARARASRLAILAAKAGEIAQALSELAATDEELASLAHLDAPRETAEEAGERMQIAAARDAMLKEREQQAAHFRSALNRVEAAIAMLPARYDERRLAEAACAVEQAVSGRDRSGAVLCDRTTRCAGAGGRREASRATHGA